MAIPLNESIQEEGYDNIEFHSLTLGPRFPLGIPRNKEEGGKWRSHIDDIELANRVDDNEPSDIEANDILRRGGYLDYPSYQTVQGEEEEEENDDDNKDDKGNEEDKGGNPPDEEAPDSG